MRKDQAREIDRLRGVLQRRKLRWQQFVIARQLRREGILFEYGWAWCLGRCVPVIMVNTLWVAIGPVNKYGEDWLGSQVVADEGKSNS